MIWILNLTELLKLSLHIAQALNPLLTIFEILCHLTSEVSPYLPLFALIREIISGIFCPVLIKRYPLLIQPAINDILINSHRFLDFPINRPSLFQEFPCFGIIVDQADIFRNFILCHQSRRNHEIKFITVLQIQMPFVISKEIAAAYLDFISGYTRRRIASGHCQSVKFEHSLWIRKVCRAGFALCKEIILRMVFSQRFLYFCRCYF